MNFASLDFDLPLIWGGIIGLSVTMYVLMDGFDLGIGMLFGFAEDEAERDQMMASIKPFWDGNETWLVLGGVGLLVAFPKAYAVLMPAVYLPVIAMLLGPVFRGVAFEFRGLSGSKLIWNAAFIGGSTIAGFAQGVILSMVVRGVSIENGGYAGGAFDWANWFALLCGFGVVAGYALLGATWLLMKTSGGVSERARRHARYLLPAVLLFMAAVSLWTPLAEPRIAERWFSLPNFYFLWPVPLVTALVAFGAWHWLASNREVPPFLAAIGLFLLGFLGLAISNFPYLVPPSLTLWDAAAAPSSQIFMLAGTAVLLPLILGYTGLIYWLFRGKVGEGESYH
ncbi:MAG: cytochrome d ubiquinol oxidase subunit II [Pseudolabrys sp.]